MKKNVSGVMKRLLLYPQRKAPGIEVQELTLAEGLGIQGDCHADGGDRQISLLSVQEKEWMEQQEEKGFCFRKYKENILVDGINLTQCRQGDLLKAGDAILELTESIKSCHPELCQLAARGTCILAGSSRFAAVRKSGVICAGMKIEKIG